jgi:acyl dehydratase
MTFLTDEVRKFIGMKSDRVRAADPISSEGVRRFVQATMDDDPIHWDPEVAASTRFGRVFAPMLFPVQAFRRHAGTSDPLDAAFTDREWDGTPKNADRGLPPPPLGLPRHLNGGSEVEFFALAHPGDELSFDVEYVDILEKEGRSGPMAIVLQDATYRNQNDQVLLRLRRNEIHR